MNIQSTDTFGDVEEWVVEEEKGLAMMRRVLDTVAPTAAEHPDWSFLKICAEYAKHLSGEELRAFQADCRIFFRGPLQKLRVVR